MQKLAFVVGRFDFWWLYKIIRFKGKKTEEEGGLRRRVVAEEG